VRGRKRQIAVDSQGNLLGASVHSAEIHDSKGIFDLITAIKAHYPSLRFAHVDQGYRGDAENTLWANGFTVTMPAKLCGGGFKVIPIRWRVERSIAWMKRWRRLACDYERTVLSSLAWIYLAGAVRMLRKLCRPRIIFSNRRAD
jgi:transposase